MNLMRSRALVLLFLVTSACGTSKAPDGSTVPLFDDLGTHHHAVTTSNETAQKYFDQGLRLVYAFNHEEAERAFREAARLDPNMAMAWWGVAYARGPNYNLSMTPENNVAALEAIQKAQALAAGASEAERGYISALARRHSEDPEAKRADLDQAYGNAMKDLSARYPDDMDAAVLYAESLMDLRPWQLWTSDGRPQEGTEEILTVLESVLARDPDHPAANHYYIHTIEASPTPEKGASSAERLKTLMPGAGHLVHMPAHIFIRTGDYEGAVNANVAGALADEAYFARTTAQGIYPLMYYTHNFQFLSTAAGMLGRSQQAIDAAAKAVANAAPMAGHDPMVEYVLPWSLYAMARNAKWDDILEYPQPADTTPVTLLMWRYARSLAHIAKGDVVAAREERQAFEVSLPKVPENAMLNTNRAHDLLNIAGALIDARMAQAAGDGRAAVALWQRAIELQDRLVYDEPPAWYYPIRESLGGEYLRARNFLEAEKVFRRDLMLNPNNPRSLFGLSEALKGLNRGTEAENFRQQFEKLWQGAELAVTVSTL